MITYYSELHHLHDPSVLPQPEGGSHNYYSEVAQRGDLIVGAVRAAGLGEVVEPSDFGIAPLGRVHSAAMLELLRSAYERMVREVHGGQHFPRAVLPETFAVRHGNARAPQSVWAHLGYYCYDTSSPIFARTWEAIYAAAQCALSAAAAVQGGDEVCYALCRPPGHHASRDLFGGFCYVNNAAVAAQFLVDAGWRVAVLDVDYHHGNGTQEIFLAHGDVLTVSIHADPQVDYPYFWGHADETGVGDGEGFNVNLPLPHGADSSVYFPALTAALERIRTFSPDALVLSLGVDTYREDPVGGFLLDVEDFPRVGERVGALGLPTVIVQEGGYALPVLGANVAGFLRGLIGG